MKLTDFAKPAPPVSAVGDGVGAPVGGSPSSPSEPSEPPVASQEAPQEEQYYTSVTPSGMEVAYSPAPRRHYKLRQTNPSHKDFSFDATEVPSVTTVLGVLDRSGPLVWWAQKVALQGVITLHNQGRPVLVGDTVDDWVKLLTDRKLSVNHQRDSAADRGVNVHGALETWAKFKVSPNHEEDHWAENERQYVCGLERFINAVNKATSGIETELMVGSLEHSYAGRFDLVLTLSKPVEVVTRAYPKRPPKIEEIPAGRYLLDLKTRKKANVYDSNYLQLEAYEAAAVECGYEPTDYRGVIVVTEDGKYQLSLNLDWTFEDFLSVRACYQTMNERGVIQALRDELDAKEVA